MILKCLVACETFNGPDIVFVMVECNEKQYSTGEHYEAAKDWAVLNGYDYPMVVMDENDPPKPIFELFEWRSASTITVH